MQPCIASIDQGTSSSRVLIINADGVVLGSHQVEHSQFYPVAGQVEHDPLEIWNSVKVCLSGAIEGLSSQVQVVAIGITNQRETTVVWNKHTGQPYHNAIVWNDTRTEDICLELSQGDADKYREKTGLPIASYFSASKLIYLLRTVPGLRQDAENGDALFGTIDTWLIWKLTNGASHVTDVTNASRTLCMDLKTLTWDDDILGDFNIPRKMLPAIHPSSYPFGNVDTDHGHLAATPITQKQLTIAPTAADATANFHLYRNTPISGVLGDQNAALFGQACFEAGDSKCTYGTGAFMLFNTGTAIMPSKSGLLTTVGYQIGASADYKSAGGEVGPPSPAVYALEGSVAYSGSVIQWLRDNLGIVKNAEESEALARSVPDNGGVYFVPAFAGLFAPYWRGDARGVIVGLTAFNTKAHIVRAALEASAFQTVEVAQAMQKDSDHKMPLVKLRVDGGGTVNSLMMQFLSDLLNVPLVKPKVAETTALGAAFMAGLGVGLWRDTDQLKGLWQADTVWEPSMPDEIRKKQMFSWRKALSRSLDWVDGHAQATDPLHGLGATSLPSALPGGVGSGVAAGRAGAVGAVGRAGGGGSRGAVKVLAVVGLVAAVGFTVVGPHLISPPNPNRKGPDSSDPPKSG